MIDLGLEEMTLSGGEPLLRDGFFEIARFFVGAGVRTDIVTNGLLVDDEMAARLADVGLYGVTVSLDGPERIHDDLRGVRGCWRQTQRAIESLTRAGLRVGAITHVNRFNLPHLDELHTAIAAGPVETWRLQLTLPVVSDTASRDLILRPAQLPELMDLIRRVQRSGKPKCYGSDDIGYYGRDELYCRRWTPEGPHRWRGCHAGISVAGLTSDGGVLGCLSLLAHGDRFLEGNIRDRSLTEIWRDPNAFACNRAFAREQRGGVCGACRFLDDCRGGCTNMLASLDPDMKENPLCLYAVERGMSQEPEARSQKADDRNQKPEGTSRKSEVRSEKENAGGGPAAAPRRPSIVILVADGMRPDFLSCYGGDTATPNLDALAASGRLVRGARAVGAWTAPSVASMFTGLPPHRLGLVKWQQRWPAEADLFTILAGMGYAVGSFPFDRRHLLAYAPQAGVAGISWNLRGVGDWLAAHHSRPSLTYIHWWGTHAPYIDVPQTTANWRRAMKLLTDTLDAHREFADKLRGMYALAIAHFDRVVVPQIVAAIERGRGWDDTVLVVTADHGESWGERYAADRPIRDVFDFHGRALYEETLRVPLVLHGAIEPGETAGPVALADLAPTLARLCGADLPPAAFPCAVDFLAGAPQHRAFFAAADRDFVDAGVVPSDPNQAFALFACLRDSQKLIKHLADGRLEWYDLAADPGETHDLGPSRPPPPELLAALDAEWAHAAPVHWDADEDREIRERLRDLGYLG